MTERLRQIKKRKQDTENILYDLVYAECREEHNRTLMFVQDIRRLKQLKDRGIISEH